MKPNFKCPKCKREITVGKKLRASYTCPLCGYSMVLTREDVLKGTKPYRSWFRTDGEVVRKPYKKFNKPFNKNYINQN
jgi:transposase-like protein